MNTYSIDYCGYTKNIQAETPAKAKYQLYLDAREWFDDGFKNFIHCIKSVRLVHKFRVSDLFGDREHFQNMKESRNIPFAEIGMKISVNGKKGVICGSNHSSNLDVCFDGTWYVENCHPYWQTVYYDDKGNVIKNYEEAGK